MRPIKTVLLILLMATLSEMPAIAYGQDDAENDSEKASALIREAIKARGGDSYMNIRNLVSRGQYTPFQKGTPGLPQSFVDYIVYPDAERTEFGKGKSKYIQTNSGNAGWVYDAQQKMIRDQTDDQVKRFQQNARHDIDNIFRRGWKEPDAKLIFVGRREVWRNTFSQAVRVEFADGDAVTLHFDYESHLPLMIEFKSLGEEGPTNDQVRFARWIDYQGVLFSTIQDFYREGQQTARVVYENVSFNQDVPDKLFAKPADIKDLK